MKKNYEKKIKFKLSKRNNKDNNLNQKLQIQKLKLDGNLIKQVYLIIQNNINLTIFAYQTEQRVLLSKFKMNKNH